MELRSGGLRGTENYQHLGMVQGTGVSQSGMVKGADLNKATELAKEMMIKKAEELGANGIININYSISFVAFSAVIGQAHVLGYGDAIRIEE